MSYRKIGLTTIAVIQDLHSGMLLVITNIKRVTCYLSIKELLLLVVSKPSNNYNNLRISTL